MLGYIFCYFVVGIAAAKFIQALERHFKITSLYFDFVAFCFVILAWPIVLCVFLFYKLLTWLYDLGEKK